MNNEKEATHIPVFDGSNEPVDYNFYIYGSKPDEDTFGKVLRRYADETTLSHKEISELAGISESGFSSYCNDHKNIGYEPLIVLHSGFIR